MLWSEVEELSLTQIRAILAKESDKPGRMSVDRFNRLMGVARGRISGD